MDVAAFFHPRTWGKSHLLLIDLALPGVAVSPVSLAADVRPVLVGLRRAPQSARRVRRRGAGAAPEGEVL